MNNMVQNEYIYLQMILLIVLNNDIVDLLY